jgi:hypothetical protein
LQPLDRDQRRSIASQARSMKRPFSQGCQSRKGGWVVVLRATILADESRLRVDFVGDDGARQKPFKLKINGTAGGKR